MSYLFPGFLNDQTQYTQAQNHWNDVWSALISRLGQRFKWETPWLNTTFADGTPCQDGNPIFSAVSKSRKLGVRVIQLSPPSTTPSGPPPGDELSVWTDTFDDPRFGMITELVLACVLTERTVSEAVDLLDQWVIHGSISFVQDEYLGRVPASRSPQRVWGELVA
jgi:hypothetical protein